MGRPRPRRARPLSAVHLAILRVLWARREASVAEVQAALARERPLALTTVATTLSRMEQKRLVAHRVEGRQYVYRALLLEEEARRSLVGDLADRLFSGDVTALVSHLLEERAVEPAELERLRALIERKKREARGGR